MSDNLAQQYTICVFIGGLALKFSMPKIVSPKVCFLAVLFRCAAQNTNGFCMENNVVLCNGRKKQDNFQLVENMFSCARARILR